MDDAGALARTRKVPAAPTLTTSRCARAAASWGERGLRRLVEWLGHTLFVPSGKDGPKSAFEGELPDAEVVFSQPFWPSYLTQERIAKAKKLKLAITAGIGSDHVDLQAAIERGL